MFKDLEKLLCHKYYLHTKKFELLRQLKTDKYFSSVTILNKVHIIINKEISNNKKIIQVLRESDYDKKEFVVPICITLKKINLILRKENSLLYHTNFLSYSVRLITGRKNYFKNKLIDFRKLTDKELQLYEIFFELSKKFPLECQIDQNEIKKSVRLILELQQELHKLKEFIGNSELVKKQGEKVLVTIGKIQNTEIYGFVKQDVEYIKIKVEYIVKHPKENKLTYFLTTVYIIAPGTFEMTGAFLFFKYLGKYTINKTKKIKERLKKN